MYYLTRFSIGGPRNPNVWLVTGIQYISRAKAVVVGPASSSADLPIAAPMLEPMAAVVTGRLGGSIGATAAVARRAGSEILCAFSHKEERAWAVQFAQLKVNYHVGAEGEEGAGPPTTIRLRELIHRPNGCRGGDDETTDDIAVIDGFEDAESESDGGGIPNAMRKVDLDLLDDLLEAA